MLERGESVIASTGLAVAAILMLSLAAAGGWSVYLQRSAARTEAQSRVESCGKLLSQSLEPLLSAHEDSTARSLLSSAAVDNGLQHCRIVLADESVFVDVAPKISVYKAATEWPKGEIAQHPETHEPKTVSASVMLSVRGRGQAKLELASEIKYPQWAGWQVQAGIGGVGTLGFAALLLVYRRLRRRVGAVGAIRESLIAMREGETSGTALAVNPRLGAEAETWNQLLSEREKMRTELQGGKARETLGARRDLKSDLANACDALWQGLMVVDEQLRIKYANGAAAVFLRTKRDDIVGAPLADSEKDPALLEAIKSVSTGGVRRRTTVELRRPEAEGGGVLRFSIRPVRREDAGGAVVMIEDITQQRVADEARNAFVAQATHELRTPLTNIRLYVEQAIELSETDTAGRAKCLNVINQETRRLERIVGDMLSVSEIEAGSFKLRTDDVRLDAVFESLREDFAAAAKDKGLTVAFDLPPKLPVIRGDRDKITLALHNLVGNAIKYTPKGGRVQVKVSEERNDLQIEVSDTGIGIKQEEQDLIFEKFYRAKDQRVSGITGSGLGLALAREVVRLHGGDIGVRSQIDQGSTFTMTIPGRAEAA